MKNYSILVNTCDSYSDAWDMFFFLLERNWKGEMPTIFLNTETLGYTNDLGVITLNSNEMSWGARLLEALSKIDDKYVLMMLEDFYYEDTIKTEIIDDCIKWLDENKSILAFQLIPSGEILEGKADKWDGKFPDFVKRKRFSNFRIIAGPTLWRKEDLVRLTLKKDSPWEWEYFGSFRTWFYKQDIYCWSSLKEFVFDYDYDHGGAIHRGKWVGYKMAELTQKYDYSLDFGNREVEFDWMEDGIYEKAAPAYKRLGSIFCNRSKMIVEIIRGMTI